MLNIVVTFCILLPIFGMVEMENGAISPFIPINGYENGATLAYIVHVAAFLCGYFLLVGKNDRLNSPLAVVDNVSLEKLKIDRFAAYCAAAFFILTIVLVFGFGGWDVLTLNIDKAQFRVSLGTFGTIIPLAMKWYMPALFSVLVYICVVHGWTFKRIWLTTIALLSLLIFGVATGFKTTVIQMLLPTAFICAPKASKKLLLSVAFVVIVNTIGLASYYDVNTDLEGVLTQLWYRLTVLQSDLTWYTWEVAENGGELPKYYRTFMPIFGDKLLILLTGVDPNTNYAEWASYYYGIAMTLFGGYPEDGVAYGFNNQATLFAETLIVGGVYFFPAVSFSFGLIVGKIAVRLKVAIRDQDYALCGALSTFFAFGILMWTLGSGLSYLFYLFNLFGFASTYILIRCLLPSTANSMIMK